MNQFKVIFIFILVTVLKSQLLAQNWLWAKSFSNTGCESEQGKYIILHPNGNIYCTGNYGANCTVVANEDSLIGPGNGNSYFASFDQNGGLLNITNLSALYSPPNYTSVIFTGKPVVDDSGYLYNTMLLQGSAVIDTINVSGFNVSMLSKWNSANRCLWTKYYTNLANPVFYNNSIYCTGSYNEPSATIDTVTLYDPFNTILNNPGNRSQGYITKLNKQGSCKWALQATGGNTKFNAFQVNNTRIYTCAQTDSCFNYDTIHACGQNGVGLGLLIQTDTNGVVKWRSLFSGVVRNSYNALGLGIDGLGNCYLLGAFDTTFYLGNEQFVKAPNDLFNIFLAKYDSLGNILWVKQIYCPNQTYVYAVHTDATGYTYILGALSGTTIFGDDTIMVQNPGLFIARYSPDGNFMGIVTVPKAGGQDIAEDADGNVYVVGGLGGGVGTSAIFGNTTLTSSNQWGDFFVAKLSAINFPANEQNLAMNDSLLQIYSNPSRGLFTVTVPQGIIQAASGTLTVYDNGGTLIKTQPVDISAPHVDVNLGEVMRGVYTVLLTANGKEFKGRVVIQ